jgi:sulfur carrier protein ThiS
VLITLILTEGEVPVEADVGSTVRDVLLQANLAPSLHIVDHEGQVLPMNTTLRRDVHLNVTRTASGG